MPVSKEQASTLDVFHDAQCRRWRRNGKTQTWKTRPDDFRTPVKYGLYAYDQLTQRNASRMHVRGDPECREAS